MRESRYFKLLAAFFMVMLALTAVSRAADSVTVAKVFAEAPKQATLAHRADAEGKILASDQSFVKGEPGALITKVYAAPGQQVKAGDPLFSVDLENARDQLLEAEADLASLRVALNKAELDQGGSAAEKAAVLEAREKLERARADSALNTELNGGTQLLSDKRAVEDAKAALETAEKQLKEAGQRNGFDLEAAKLQLAGKERNAAKLRQICEGGGIIRAEVEGTVGEVKAAAGVKVTEEILCTLIPGDAQYRFEGQLSDEDAKYMKVGDPVSVTLDGRNVPISGLTIRSLSSTGGETTVTAEIPKDARIFHGMAASMSHSSVSQSYGCTVPIGALRGSEGGYYVLEIEESSTVLGREQKAVRTPVTLIDKDNKRAAVEERLDGSVISVSSKPVEAGDRVREVQDEEL